MQGPSSASKCSLADDTVMAYFAAWHRSRKLRVRAAKGLGSRGFGGFWFRLSKLACLEARSSASYEDKYR